MSLSGKLLKEVREQRGLSLEQVSSDLKIHIRILQALEEERTDVAVPEAIRKGFLRSYARYLKIDMGANQPIKRPDGANDTVKVDPIDHAGKLKHEELNSAKNSRATVDTDEGDETFAWRWVALVVLGIVGVRVFFWLKENTLSSSQPSKVSIKEANVQEQATSVVGNSAMLDNSAQESNTSLSFSPSEKEPFTDIVVLQSSELNQMGSQSSSLGMRKVSTPVEHKAESDSHSISHAPDDRGFRWLLVSAQKAQTLSLQTSEGERKLAVSPKEHYLIKLLLPAQLVWEQPQSVEIVDEARRVKAASPTSVQIQ